MSMRRNAGILALLIVGAPLVASAQTNLHSTFTFPSSHDRTVTLTTLPSFGFDFVHVAAVNRDLGVRALIDPVTQFQLAQARQLQSQVPAIVPLITFPVIINSIQVNVAPPPPTVIVISSGRSSDENSVASLRPIIPQHKLEPDSAPSPGLDLPVVQPPPRELGEIVLLRMDGTMVFAVAYSVTGDRITYITREGLRRSFPLSALDSEATLQLNEQRGTLLRLPAS
ncbi:MAG: hypothetical protein HY046_07145 [Acidobacteria bacterium]|nr:hypothetical protein [Acidobacteriota bacterium]